MVIPLRIKGAFEMNGKRYLLDTNAFIQLLSGNGSECSEIIELRSDLKSRIF